MSFGYFPDFKKDYPLKDFYLRLFGYPYPPRRNEVRRVFHLLNPKSSDRILDVGCGDGVWTNHLAKKGCVATGIDISKHDLRTARERAEKMKHKVKYIQADATKMPFKPQSFDKIYSISTLEHIKNDFGVLEECFRVLKSHGSLVISVPQESRLTLPRLFTCLPKDVKKRFFSSVIVNSQNPEEYQKYWNKKFRQFRTYTPQTLRKKLEGVGFTVAKEIGHTKFFGKLPQNILESLKIFEWKKNPEKGYHFQSELAHAAAFPLFYPLYLLDDIVPKKEGRFIVVKAVKN